MARRMALYYFRRLLTRTMTLCRHQTLAQRGGVNVLLPQAACISDSIHSISNGDPQTFALSHSHSNQLPQPMRSSSGGVCRGVGKLGSGKVGRWFVHRR